MVVVATGWEMYDLRSTVKGQVYNETILIGQCCYIDANGINLSDDDASKCHGVALKNAVAGDKLVLVTEGRLLVQTAQVPGADVKSPKEGSGVGSAPDDGGTGSKVGFATAEYVIQVNIDSVSAVSV